MTYQSFSPYSGTLIKGFAEITPEQIEAKLAQAQACYAPWRAQSYAHRATIIARAGAILHARADEFARLITLEMGKRLSEAHGEIEFSAQIMAYYAAHAANFLAPEPLHPASGTAHVESSPIGVIFGIQPWNFPFYQLARIAGPHLMAGNTLVVKHSETVPQCALAFEAILREAGAPEGLYTNLFITHAQSSDLIDDPRIKGVCLTGSVRAGREVAGHAGRALKVSTMELGGSDPFIVLEDADMDHTIPWALWGRMYNAGQTCCAAKRFIVIDSVADHFIARLRTVFEALVPGDPLDATTTLAPLSSEAALLRLLAQVEQAVARGASLLIGGKAIERTGSFMQPTILTDITPDNPAFHDEFFGPVALIFRVQNEAEAIALANHSDFGLGGSVWTQDLARGARLASQIESGMVFINTLDWADADLPFGGIKDSGYGRELGAAGIRQFVNRKLVRTSDSPAP